jgi:hypothetical protein
MSDMHTVGEWVSLFEDNVPYATPSWDEVSQRLVNLELPDPITFDWVMENAIQGVEQGDRNPEALANFIVEYVTNNREHPVTIQTDIDILQVIDLVSGGTVEADDNIEESLNYHFSNWKVGRYTVPVDYRAATRQMATRWTRKYSGAYPGWLDSHVYWGVISYLLAVAKGEKVTPHRVRPGSRDAMEAILREQNLGESDRYYAAKRAMEFLSVYDYAYPLPVAADVERRLELNIAGSSYGDEIREALEFCVQEFLMVEVTAIEKPDVTDFASLSKWLHTVDGGAEEFQSQALDKGLADYVDALREGEVAKGKEVEVLRTAVRSYGHLRFTGKSRVALAAALEAGLTGMEGKALNSAELRARWARMMSRVEAVAGRYGEQHSMCPQLEAACKELGLELNRHPKGRTVLMKGNGMTIRIPVESWSMDAAILQDKARVKWETWTPEEKEAAVVSREGVHVTWSNMKPVS